MPVFDGLLKRWKVENKDVFEGEVWSGKGIKPRQSPFIEFIDLCNLGHLLDSLQASRPVSVMNMYHKDMETLRMQMNGGDERGEREPKNSGGEGKTSN
ncbi:unnamed protein product [Dovyalis caffra]|uniref:Uncharacterized protein n=1 Tax=Dovyalis caffra TaxID=77055 RepID=A0AAV1S7L6_9ROSI|nr:unnamed protein product [Dovyalis caffra]